MSISQSRYIDITSGIGGNGGVATRDLGAMIITLNPLVPTGQVVTFTSADDVGAYFGTLSGEYKRAVFYFGWVSKNITTPKRLSFWFWNNDAASDSLIFGKPATYALSQFTSITTGDFTLTMGGFTDHLTAIDLSGDASLAAVAATLQAKIRAFSGGGTAWTGATVSYDATRGCFDLVSGLAGADTISVTAGVTTDVAAPLGWLTGAILSNGQAAQTVPQNLAALLNVSNDFGSFCYGSSSTTLSTVLAAALWNNSTTPNNLFMFSWVVTPTNAATWAAALAAIGGNTGTLQSPVTGEYPEMEPMMIMAATDYTARNSVQNYMFQVFNLTPSVTTDADANTYDALRINYYGQTQTAGQFLQFYQRGLMMGLPVNPSDQNIYANEIWLKDDIGAGFMNLLLALSKVSANAQGRSQLLAVLQGSINRALFNGTISVGKPLNTTQQLYITQATGDPKAWLQVQNSGYWVNVVFQSFVDTGGATEFKAVYTLIYSKDDDIRLIQGSDILI